MVQPKLSLHGHNTRDFPIVWRNKITRSQEICLLNPSHYRILHIPHSKHETTTQSHLLLEPKGNMSLQTKPSTTHHLLVNLVANTNIPNKIGPSPTRLHAIQRATIGHKSQWHEANWMQHMIPTKWTVIVKILLY